MRTHEDAGTVPVRERVLYEDNHIIAVAKLPSEIVQSDISGDPTLADAVKEYIRVSCGKPGNVFLGIPHRLDRPTSGVVLFARTGKALARLAAMFRDREIRKLYWAVVDKLPPEAEGRLEHYLIRDRQKNKSFAVPSGKKGAKKALLTYRLVRATKSYYMLEIELETGRHHQIRAQLAALNIHIKGDLKYGAPRSNPGGGISLHARQVEFVHPVTGKPFVITAPFPEEQIWQSVEPEPV
jgi:23S rRNA pseudouridine1911/1915/1917 synthase